MSNTSPRQITAAVLDYWCANGGHPRDPICDESLPLSERLALNKHSHPTAFCHRDRVAIIATMQMIDGLINTITALRAEVERLRNKLDGPMP